MLVFRGIRPLCWACLLCLTGLLVACEQRPVADTFDLNAVLGGDAATGFSRADRPRAFHFPADHAAHPDFRNEWWYVTGNLRTDSGRHFGYQVTFFRIALAPASGDQSTANQAYSPWQTRQVWMAHVALTDVGAQQHYHDQRFARGAAGLAGQRDEPFRVWLEDWQLVATRQGEFPWAVTVQTNDFALNLQLMPTKPVVLQGEQGLSQKSAAPGNASYYYSLTRLDTVGDIHLAGERFVVAGSSWLDREWSTSVLGDDQEGWDWFSLQLPDQQELMYYRLRRKDGSTDPLSAGKWVLADGSTRSLAAADVVLKPLRYWQSGDGRRYPVEWSLSVPAQAVHWRVSALVDDQLMQTGITYWEGAVQVTERGSGVAAGLGYLEMSGY